MKRFLRIYANSFLGTAGLLFLITGGIFRRLNLTFSYFHVTVGAVIIALLITFSVMVLRMEKGKSWINAILAFLIALPSLAVIQRLFGIIVFRFAFVLYAVIGLIGIVYAIAIATVSKKYKKEVDELNRLLSESKDEESESAQ